MSLSKAFIRLSVFLSWVCQYKYSSNASFVKVKSFTCHRLQLRQWFYNNFTSLQLRKASVKFSKIFRISAGFQQIIIFLLAYDNNIFIFLSGYYNCLSVKCTVTKRSEIIPHINTFYSHHNFHILFYDFSYVISYSNYIGWILFCQIIFLKYSIKSKVTQKS